jgi:hypothetical protein
VLYTPELSFTTVVNDRGTLAHDFPLLSTTVEALALKVVDVRSGVYPNQPVARAGHADGSVMPMGGSGIGF